MKPFTRLLLAFLFIQIIFSCYHDSENRNKLEFNDSYERVEDSLTLMINLLNKVHIEYGTMRNYFVDSDGFLYVNNNKLPLLNDITLKSETRKNRLFLNLSDKEFVSFLNIINFLQKNHIQSAHFEGSIGQFFFTYKEPERGATINTLRGVLIVEDAIKIDKKIGLKYEVIDEYGRMKLIAIKEEKR